MNRISRGLKDFMNSIKEEHFLLFNFLLNFYHFLPWPLYKKKLDNMEEKVVNVVK